jgi:hypothetical protein
MAEAYDLVAIGAGPAGESAAELAAFYRPRRTTNSLLDSDPLPVRIVGRLAQFVRRM